jgi:MFS family permease
VVTGAVFVFFLYIGVMIPLIPRLIENELGGNELDIGLNLAVFSIAAIAIRPALGVFAERRGLRLTMVIGALLAAVASVVSAFVHDRFMLLPLRGVQGIGEAALFVGGATLINEFAPSHRRAEAASYFSVAVFAGIGIGPIIGEAVIGSDRYALGLLVSALFAAAAAALSTMAPDSAVHHDAAHPSGPRFHRAAFLPGMVLGLGIAGFATFNAFMPGHATDIGLDGAKWVFALYSVVCVVIRIVGAKWPERMGLPRAVTTALIGIALGLFVIGAWAHPAGVYLGAFTLAFGMSFLYPSLLALAVNSVPERERVRLISTFTMFFEIGTAFGAIVLGALAELTSKRGGFVGGGFAELAGLVILWRLLVPTLRQRPISASAPEVVAAH